MPPDLDIIVRTTHAVADVLPDLVPAFERTSGYRLSCRYNPTAVVKREIEDGAAFDVAIITRPAIDDLADRGAILRDTCMDLGRSGLGLAVRRGAPKPRIDTAADFKRALLAAKSVVRSQDGASGQYFEALIARLGIADALRGKIVIGPAGRVAELVARGEAELAVQQVPELLPVMGADFVGPFPAELQAYTVFAAGVSAACTRRAGAQALITALAAPANVALYRSRGLEPVAR